jgi:hypothetical protein
LTVAREMATSISSAYIGEVQNAAHMSLSADNPNTTQTLEYTKDKYNVRIIK